MSKRRTYTKRQLYLKYILVIVGILLGLAVILLSIALIMRASGKNKLKKNAVSEAPTIMTDEMVQEKSLSSNVNWKEGWIRYNGDIYEYNSDIMTFLIMGIDSHGTVTANKDLTSGGQADALFLAIANPEDESIKIFAVNRDTMVDVNMVGIGDGGTDIVYKAQIATTHGFGDGMEGSCKLTEEAVSKLLYNIPIHGYMSVNFDAIPIINDAIGGVDIKVEGDWSSINKKWTDGAAITLMGKEAYDYVHYRDTSVFASQEGRLSRQKTYLKSFIKKALTETKSDVTLPISIYTGAKDYIVTDLTIDEISYMATTYAGYTFDSEDIYMMEGEVVTGVDFDGEHFEEFYPDEEALQEQIIKLFYRKIEQ